VRRYWQEPDLGSGWPLDEPEVVRFAVVVGEQVVGLVQYSQEDDPDYRHASLDIFLDPAVHGQGVGRDAIATLAAHLVDDHRHHRLVIDPAADNHAAIRCYGAVGFRSVGVMRRYERDSAGSGWHDGLLMDLLAEDLERRPTAAGRG
jgi:aminoglycoside 6'-N-acetyltransferase